MFVIVWRYTVRADADEEFRAAYGASGDWAELFGRSRQFLGVELMAGGPREYLTIDRWESEAAFDAFMETMREEYQRLDRRCASLTDDEQLVLRGHPVALIEQRPADAG